MHREELPDEYIVGIALSNRPLPPRECSPMFGVTRIDEIELEELALLSAGDGGEGLTKRDILVTLFADQSLIEAGIKAAE
jgi:hypothetical protein